jgi:hypothetical protein
MEEVMSDYSPVARQRGLVVQEMSGEVLVYDLTNNKAHCLNETAALVWRSCNGKNSVDKIAVLMSRSLGDKVTNELVWLAVDQLNEKGLLDAGPAIRFAGRSRREAIRNIGLATVAAIPVVASLVAPPGVAAASCTCATVSNCGNGCPTASCKSGACSSTP